ncbi:MAG: DUF3047 domain-containing protein [Hydrogenophaga sp.]|nr:DUF3047 domain-containing protein [Hydrogenophaga sp.]
MSSALFPRSPRLWACLLALLLTACANAPSPSANGADDEAATDEDGPKQRPVVLDGTAWSASNHIDGAAPSTPWEHQVFVSRRPTRYQATEHAGRPALRAEALGSNSTLNLLLKPAPGTVARHLHFSLFVPALNPGFDLGEKGSDDAVARLILSFDGDRYNGTWKARDHVISELSGLIAGKPLPYASIMYVWDNRYPAGTVIPNPYTGRIRQIVVESGTARLNQWVDFDRDVEADFRMAFGEAPGPMIGLGLMTDSNNSGASVSAWYGPLELTMAPPTR